MTTKMCDCNQGRLPCTCKPLAKDNSSLVFDCALADFQAKVWEAAADEESRVAYDEAGLSEAKRLIAMYRALRAQLAERNALLRLARQFVVNGVDLGYIQMPDADTPDPAHDLVPMIDAALSASAEPAERDAPLPDYMQAVCDKFDWTPAEALRFYAEGKHFDIDNGRTRILCTGSIASHALKGLSREYAEQKRVGSVVEPAAVALPELTDDLRFILGRPNFTLSSTAAALRMMGIEIAYKSEDEQAAAIYWMLGHYLKDPEEWRLNASDELQAGADEARRNQGAVADGKARDE